MITTTKIRMAMPIKRLMVCGLILCVSRMTLVPQPSEASKTGQIVQIVFRAKSLFPAGETLIQFSS
jgi:hypothetical protein